MTTFHALGLAAPILRAVELGGYITPTPIQSQAIPPILAGRDLLGLAQTGTGKTAAFALPILQRLSAQRRQPGRKSCRALVLSPTRELATQIAESFRTYGKLLDLKVAIVFGGTAHGPQIAALAGGVDVLVATPGRLLDHLAARHISLQSTEVFVLDEADQMLDLGFVKPIRRIVSHLPQSRQNLFFSATMPREIGDLASELLRNPVRVAITPPATTVQAVSQSVFQVEASRKRALLVTLLSDPQMSRTLVFTRTKRGADKLARHLAAAGIPVTAIHGNKSQRQREQALAAFKGAKVRALVATDIAARGIDIDDISHVVNYELPDTAESYVHRIGRTARAGAKGIAISLCDHEEREKLRDIERLIRQKIPQDPRSNSGADTDRPSRLSSAGEQRAKTARARTQSPAGRQHSHRDAAVRNAAPRHREAPRPIGMGPDQGMAGVAFMAARGLSSGKQPTSDNGIKGRSAGRARQRLR